MSDDVPNHVRQRFDRAVAFVGVLDLLSVHWGGELLPEQEEMMAKNAEEIEAALNDYPNLNPQVRADMVDIVRTELVEESEKPRENLDKALDSLEDYLTHYGPVSLKQTGEDGTASTRRR